MLLKSSFLPVLGKGKFTASLRSNAAPLATFLGQKYFVSTRDHLVKRPYSFKPSSILLNEDTKKPFLSNGKPTVVNLSNKEFENIFETKKRQEPLVDNFNAETSKRMMKSKRPINTDPRVAYWLLFTASLVFAIIFIGGLTRLTESGLSITEWKPITGAIPPLTQADWEEEFTKYKNSPEFKQLNSHMNLEDFKFIFYYEWGHRLLGRGIGLIFVVPMMFLLINKKFTSYRTNKRLFAMAGLLGLQGFIGWWMVRSGLDEDELIDRKSKPTVSQYRLTTHLSTAFVLYLGMLYTSWEILRENKWLKDPKKAIELLKVLENPQLKRLRGISRLLLVFTFATAMSGGMVAGLDAGLIYNNFPKMGETWFPSSGELFNNHYLHSNDDPNKDLIWRNLLENPATVQLVHRYMAITTFSLIMATQMYVMKMKRKGIVPRYLSKIMHGVAGIASAQVALGIATLIYIVPISLASIHQCGAIFLLTWCALFNFKIGKGRPIIRQGLVMMDKRGINL